MGIITRKLLKMQKTVINGRFCRFKILPPISRIKMKVLVPVRLVTSLRSQFQILFRKPRKTASCDLLPRPIRMSWACKNCTFLNSSSGNLTCEICFSSNSLLETPSSSSPSLPKWPCKACTFLNPYKNTNCDMCDTRSSVSSLSNFVDLIDTDCDDRLDSSVGSVFLPLQRCKRKTMDPTHTDEDSAEVGWSKLEAKASKKVSDGKDSDLGTASSSSKIQMFTKDSNSSTTISMLKVLTYNVWFREDLEVHKRMKAIGDLIVVHSPEFICLQEVTPDIYDILKQSSWWKEYHCSVTNENAYSRPYFCMVLSKLPVKSFRCHPFRNSAMGRELCIAEVEGVRGKRFIFATSHLESPCPGPPTWDQMFSKERVEQAKEAVNLLKENPNVIFGGDMNWDDKLDGQFPLPEGWLDAWAHLRPDENGWTYDTKSNKMLSGNRSLQKRLDRLFCSLRDFKISEIEMIGKDAIPGVSYIKEKKLRKEMKKIELPVLPSDHYGLLLTISSLS